MSARMFLGVRLTALVASLLLVVGMLGLLAPAARADSAPLDPADPATPATVTADRLPTVQINGVAWSQVVVGRTVYVAGKFSTARPAGAAPGTQETVRNNLLAFDIRTGELVTSFAPDLNAQALAVAASPDGSRIYVGGDFSRANGQTRNRVAAYDTATGALVASFKPSVAGQVRAIAATDSTVYLGGNISAVGSVSRTRLAAVSASSGALLPWAPVPGAAATNGSNEILSMVVTSGGSQVVVGGRFAALNGVAATGVGALDATSGATKPFAVNKLLTNQGAKSGIWGLSTDGTSVYGSAYDYYGPGNFEGTFAADSEGGALRFAAFCRGDNYSNFAGGGVLYVASHMHNCSYIGGFPEQSPQVFKHGTAFSLTPTRKIVGGFTNDNFAGKPAPSLLPWFPTMTQGSYTGQFQAGWSVTGDSQYVVYGGEFPRVNGVGQQGLVRYAKSPLAPNKIGPETTPAPTATAIGPGAVRIGWKAGVDPDNEHLTYRVYRDGDQAAPIGEFTRPSTWWRAPGLSFTDRGVSAGAHTYKVTVSDPAGNQLGSDWVSATATAGGGTRPYADAVHADGAINHWSLGGASGSTAYDQAGISDATIGSGVGRDEAGAISGDNDTAMSFNGTSNGLVATQTAVAAPQTFSVEAWFQTTTRLGGKIVGFGSASSGNSSAYDRHIFMTTTGRVSFGIYSGATRTVTSPGAYNDGRWHHVVGTMGRSGLTLFIDGTQVGQLAGATEVDDYAGYWRVGGDSSWSGAPYFKGRIDEVAIYPRPITAGQVTAHHTQGSTGVPANAAPTAAFTTSIGDLTAGFDASASADRDGTVAAYAWDFGDGTTASGVTVTKTFTAAGTYAVTLTVTDDDGATATRTEPVSVVAPPPNVAPEARFTASVGGRAVTVDGSGSTDRDGRVAELAWDFGDGTTAAGPTATHVYAANGTYTVTLTVTDDEGASGSIEKSVAVAGQPVIASDTFDRSVAGGLGTADVGGAWTVSAGGTRQSVSGSAATFALTGGTNTGSYLGAVAQTSADVRTTLSFSEVPTGGGATVYVTGRRVSANQEYRGRLRILADGSVRVGVIRLSGSSSDVLIGSEALVPGVTYTRGTVLKVRLQVSGTGTTTVAATVWADGSTEPTAPTVSRTDTTAELQAAGAVGLTAYLAASATAPVDLRFADFTVAPVGAVNKAPTAAFTSAESGLASAFDASGSADADGAVTGYAWTFGDGTTGSGRSVSHTYADGGTYAVRLTVTDDEGASAWVERQVTVTAPPPPPPPAAVTVLASDEFDRSATGGLGSADVGGTWTAVAGGTRQSVSGGTATFALTKGTNTASVLGSVAATDAAVRTTLSLSEVPTGGGAMVYVTGRRVAANQEYRARVRILADGSVRVALVRLSGSTSETLIGSEVLVPGVTYTAGMPLNVLLKVSGTGTTELAATVWADGAGEPGTPTVTRTDTTAELQAAGGVGLAAYLTGTATAPVDLRFAVFTATSTGN